MEDDSFCSIFELLEDSFINITSGVCFEIGNLKGQYSKITTIESCERYIYSEVHALKLIFQSNIKELDPASIPGYLLKEKRGASEFNPKNNFEKLRVKFYKHHVIDFYSGLKKKFGDTPLVKNEKVSISKKGIEFDTKMFFMRFPIETDIFLINYSCYQSGYSTLRELVFDEIEDLEIYKNKVLSRVSNKIKTGEKRKISWENLFKDPNDPNLIIEKLQKLDIIDKKCNWIGYENSEADINSLIFALDENGYFASNNKIARACTIREKFSLSKSIDSIRRSSTNQDFIDYYMNQFPRKN
jgi:hypothetical protein